jgi:protein-S-isoprenylcysteine O-methyltransferase Ste14
MADRGRLITSVQLLSATVACVPVAWPPQGWWWGLGLVALGLWFGLWTMWHNRPGNFSIWPQPSSDAQLITTGPYAWVRHPMYTALCLNCAGLAVWYGTWYQGLAAALVLPIVVAKARLEERHLRQLFATYPAYAAITPMLLPRPRLS